LNRFIKIRPWIPVSQARGFKFSVLSYNVLAQNLLAAHPYLYSECSDEAISWHYRWQGIKREIIDIRPDIGCLQEVQFKNPDHFSQQFKPFLDSLGYKYVSKAKTGSKVDGCLIFYNSDKFHLEEESGLEYKINRVALMDRDNVGLVCKLVPIGQPESPFVVATTHLLYNPKRTDIRLCQTAMFLAELDRISRTSQNSEYLPAIITGDLNSEPDSPVLQLLMQKSFQYAGVQLKKRHMPQKLLPDSLGLSDSCQWQVDLEQRGQKANYSTGSFYHNFNLQSVHSPYEGVTTYQDKWTMVDYMMFNQGRNEKLKMVSKLALPNSSNMSRLPSNICPSDHLPIVARFSLQS